MKYNIEEIIKLFESSNVSKLELEIGEMKIKLEKDDYTTNNRVVTNIADLEKETYAEGYKVLAPVVGTFYDKKAPGQPPYVKIGDKVKVGDTLCIIEAMKVMNEITCKTNGVIKDIVVQNETLVEFDQVLFIIEE